MEKTKITLCTVGQMPVELDQRSIEQWRSDVFELTGRIESYALNSNSDGPDWEFSDATIDAAMPQRFAGDVLLAVVQVPLKDRWYARRLSENRIAVSLDEMQEILKYSHIPLHNLILRVMYGYTLVYRRFGGVVPGYSEGSFVHDETRGCLFDMNGLKTDVIHSCNRPKLCTSCVEKMREQGISNEVIEQTDKEIRNIKKDLFYRIADFVKAHPLRSIALTSLGAVILGVVSSVIAALLMEHFLSAI